MAKPLRILLVLLALLPLLAHRLQANERLGLSLCLLALALPGQQAKPHS